MPAPPVSISRHATIRLTERPYLQANVLCSKCGNFVRWDESVQLAAQTYHANGATTLAGTHFQAVLSHPKTSAYPAHSYLQLIRQSRFALARLVADQSLSGSKSAVRDSRTVKG